MMTPLTAWGPRKRGDWGIRQLRESNLGAFVLWDPHWERPVAPPQTLFAIWRLFLNKALPREVFPPGAIGPRKSRRGSWWGARQWGEGVQQTGKGRASVPHFRLRCPNTPKSYGEKTPWPLMGRGGSRGARADRSPDRQWRHLRSKGNRKSAREAPFSPPSPSTGHSRCTQWENRRVGTGKRCRLSQRMMGFSFYFKHRFSLQLEEAAWPDVGSLG